MNSPLLKCKRCKDEYLYKAGKRTRTVRTLKGVVREPLQLYLCGVCQYQETEVSELAPLHGNIGWDVIGAFVKLKRSGLSLAKACNQLEQTTGFRMSTSGAGRIFNVYGGI